MTDAEIQLQNAVTTTFLANLAFLSEYDNELFHRVDELSRMIERSSYKEKYTLEFIMENGDFDIYDIVNKKYLYERKPKKIIDQLVRKIEFNQKEAIFNIEDHFFMKRDIKIDIQDRFKYKDESDLINITLNDLFEYSNILKDFLQNKKKQLKKIKKFIFLGTLLGRHIPRIANKIDAEMYLVCERNLEIFRLSLFTVDYTILAKKGVIFSIMDEPQVELKKIERFININNLDNYLLKFSTTNINIENYVDSILAYLVSNKPTLYDYNRYLYIKINRTTKMLNSEYKTLLFNKIREKCDFFENMPILYLAAGPSLDENIKWIKENQNKFFIVTIGAAYKKLLKNNIKIDMITSLDEKSILSEIQFDTESVLNIDLNTIVILSCSTSQQVIEKFNKHKLFLYETSIGIHKNNIALDGFSIGEITLDILLKMNAKEIYILGLDLALNQDTGLSHSAESNSLVKKFDLNKSNDKEFFSLSEGIIKVKGNLKEEVVTTSLFYNSIQSIKGKLEKEDFPYTIYNLSTHGAYFENTIPKEIKEIDIQNYNVLDIGKKELNEFFIDNSLNRLSEDSKEEIHSELKFLRKVMENELNKFKESEFKDYEELKIDFLKLIELISKNKFRFISQIINDYSKIILPYLSFHFNDIKIKNENKKIKKIKVVMVKQIDKILNDYILCLERLK